MVLASWHTSLHVSPNHISGSTISKPQNSVEKDDPQFLFLQHKMDKLLPPNAIDVF
jgi:hypothetical protein